MKTFIVVAVLLTTATSGPTDIGKLHRSIKNRNRIIQGDELNKQSDGHRFQLTKQTIFSHYHPPTSTFYDFNDITTVKEIPIVSRFDGQVTRSKRGVIDWITEAAKATFNSLKKTSAVGTQNAKNGANHAVARSILKKCLENESVRNDMISGGVSGVVGGIIGGVLGGPGGAAVGATGGIVAGATPACIRAHL